MIYQRGQRSDYDAWRALLDGTDGSGDSSSEDRDRAWSADDMRRLLDKHLDYAPEFTAQGLGPTSAGLEGAGADAAGAVASVAERDWSALVGGEWRVEAQRLAWQVLDDVAEAAEAQGLPRRTHFNSSDQAGCGYFQVRLRTALVLLACRTRSHIGRLTVNHEHSLLPRVTPLSFDCVTLIVAFFRALFR
jgi:choline dehydrogenase-like flavoprotein